MARELIGWSAGVISLLLRQRKRIGLFLLPWAVLIGLAFPLLWWQVEEGPREARTARGQDLLRSVDDIIQRVLDRLGRDILFLSSIAVQLPPQDLTPEGIGGRIFASFASSSPDYDQVRWLDEAGLERLRVDRAAGAVGIVSLGELQDKADRPYFKDSRDLPAKAVYFSAIDLNVEHGVVEQPFKPMLRVATPVVPYGVRRGIVIINYAMASLLARIQKIAGDEPALSLFLINSDGYWIRGPSAEDDWAWQRPGDRGSVFRDLPELWQSMQAEPHGQWQQGSHYWLFRRVTFGNRLITAGEASTIAGPGTTLYVAVRMNEAHAEWQELEAKILLSVMAVVFAVMMLVIGVRLAGSLEREASHRRALVAANADLRDANRHLQEVQQEIARAERLSSLGLMVAGVAHELNTPLGSATLTLSKADEDLSHLERRMVEGLRRSDLTDFVGASHGNISLARDAIQRCSELVRRFKQVAVDRATVARRKMDLAETVLDADPRLRRWSPSEGIALHLELEPGVEMDSYPGPLSQVISNLLNNTLKHAFPEGRHGTMHLRAVRKGRTAVTIEIRDDGVGIPAEILPRIFEPFFTTARGRGGTGLGLHIVHQIVTDLLGGRISVESPVAGLSRGTCFTLELPLVAPDPRSAAEDPRRPA
ncbi:MULTISPECIES: sensor histidine kinase [unclassified Xanthobacter]|uniref:sensor histidine kinase n=1 Tax=unclassified Xanthobacter TaxID=2623496 RepID=UPI001EE05252